VSCGWYVELGQYLVHAVTLAFVIAVAMKLARWEREGGPDS